MDNAPNVAKGIQGFALASIVTVAAADLFRLPMEAYYSGMVSFAKILCGAELVLLPAPNHSFARLS
jgi:hypothetical protein